MMTNTNSYIVVLNGFATRTKPHYTLHRLTHARRDNLFFCSVSRTFWIQNVLDFQNVLYPKRACAQAHPSNATIALASLRKLASSSNASNAFKLLLHIHRLTQRRLHLRRYTYHIFKAANLILHLNGRHSTFYDKLLPTTHHPAIPNIKNHVPFQTLPRSPPPSHHSCKPCGIHRTKRSI